MKGPKPLWEKLYRDEICIEIVRMVGYAGISYRDFMERMEQLKQQHGHRVHETANRLVMYEGKFRTNVAPLTQVTLAPEVRKLSFQLLGPAPDHPEYDRLKSSEPFLMKELGSEAPKEEPKPRRRKKQETP